MTFLTWVAAASLTVSGLLFLFAVIQYMRLPPSVGVLKSKGKPQRKESE